MQYTQPGKLTPFTLATSTAGAGAGLLYACVMAGTALLPGGAVLGVTGALLSSGLLAATSLCALSCSHKGWQAREEILDRVEAAKEADKNRTEPAYVPSKFLDPREQPSGLVTTLAKAGGMFMMVMGGLYTMGASWVPGLLSLAVGYCLHQAGTVGEETRTHAEAMTQEAAHHQRRTMSATEWAKGYGATIPTRTDWADRIQSGALSASKGRNI